MLDGLVARPKGRPKRSAPVLSPQKETKFRRLNHIPISEDIVKSPHAIKLELAAAAFRPGVSLRGGLLPCRSSERKKIATHLRIGVEQGGSAQVLYVSGMPGTGKTAIVLEVLEHLKKFCQFHLVHINAMRLGAPVQVFKEIADQMLIETNNSQARGDVTEHFNSRRAQDPVVVLLIDEVDCLVTPSQAVLYKVFDWLGMPNARLVLAAISNTMDLPERLLPRVASRFHIERVDFTPYNKTQLYEILCSRLQGHDAQDIFNDVVLRLCAARVAAATGDIRKALQVCRRAVETRLQNADNEGPVTIADLEAAEKELILANPMATAILRLSLQARRFLSAVVIELKRKDADSVLLRKATWRYQRLMLQTEIDCERSASLARPSTLEGFDVYAMVHRLEAMGMLRKQACLSSSVESVSSGPSLYLGTLDIEDLKNTLVKVEEDSLVRALLEGERLGAEALRIYKPID
jgi:Cdc6-like AAA superfamily ATPase